MLIKNLDKLNLLKLANGGLVLGSSQFLLLPQLPLKMILASKVVKSDSKIIILVHKSKYVTQRCKLFENTLQCGKHTRKCAGWEFTKLLKENS